MLKKQLVTMIFILLAAGILAQGQTTSSVYGFMAVAGDINNWQPIPNMYRVAKNTWQSEFNVTASRFAFKFVASNNWYYNWGIIRATQTNHFLPVAGTAAWRPGDGNDIIVSNAVPGLYRFTFNDSNFQFRVEMLYSAASGVNLLTNPSFEIEGSYTERAHGWEWGYPDTHGDVWNKGSAGRALRQNWRSHSGSWIATLCGKWWSGAEDFGGWWRDGAAFPGLTYEGSVWAWADSTWTASNMEIKIEFYDASYNKLGVTVSPITNISSLLWQRYSMRAYAPENTAWARFVMAMSQAGTQGALQFDDAELRAVATRSQNFDAWGAFTNDGYHEWDWIMNQGMAVSNAPSPQPNAGVLISEYVEGSSNNKAVEIYNGNSNALNLTAGNYYLMIYNNGSPTAGSSIALSGTIEGLDTFVICHSSATSSILNIANQSNSLVNFNGNDAIVLRSGGTNGPIVDRFGRVGENPGDNGWGGITTDKTLRRKSWIYAGDTNATAAFVPTEEWDVLPLNTFNGLGYHTITWGDTYYTPHGFSANVAAGISNYIRSAEFDGGVGSITFWYRAAATSPAIEYAIQTSQDATNWSTVATLSGVNNTNWIPYATYVYDPDGKYIRLLHTAGSNRFYIDEIAIAEPELIQRVEDFSKWTNSEYQAFGQHERNGWLLSDGKAVTQNARLDQCVWIRTNSYLRTPWFDLGAGNIEFWYRNEIGTNPIDFSVQYSTDSNTWHTIRDFTAAESVYTFASIDNYIPEPCYVRIHHNLNTNYYPSSLLVDDVNIRLPVVYRSQNFDQWPSTTSYGDSEFQRWSVHQAMIDSSGGYIGQGARMRETVSQYAYIQSPPIPDGLGALSFYYKKFSDSGTAPTYAVQVSSNGANWTTLTNLVITSSAWTNFALFMYDTNNRYVRLYHTAGATRAVFDVIAIGLPRPPPDVILNGWHQPNNPYTGDTVRIYGNALTAYGAEKVVMTSYYRVGTSGVWTALAMQTDEGVNFATTASLGPYPTGTVVQYYIACRFSGTGSEINSPRYYPTGGPTNPAAFVIPRNPPGRVWINEINYMNMLDWDDDTNEFVEVCGPAGFDLGGWRIEFYMTGADTNTYTYYASYILPKLSILSNQVNGFGFFVLGDPSAILANVNLTLTNIIYAWDPYNQISDGVYPSGIRLINEAGGFEQSISYRGPIQGFNQISASEYWQNADPKDVQMTGTGSYYTNFTWITNVTYTPGAVNVGQTLVKPADPETPPIVDIIQTVFGTNIWITTYGNTNSWIVAPYAATNLNRSQTWLAVSPFNSVYKGGGTNLLWFNIPSTGANYYYRILITKPGS